MISLVKHHTRRFHVTSKVFLRKVVPKVSSNDQKWEFPESKFDTSSNHLSSCPDYLGIESDENVINVVPQRHQIQQPQISDIREKFYHASFGIVRLDTDNKVKYHGQRKRKVDFTFPYSSSETVKVSNISQAPSNENKIDQVLSLKKDSQTVSTVNTLNIKTSESSLFGKKDPDINYIDEAYFDTSAINNAVPKEIEHPVSEELNFLEKDYFETYFENLSSHQNTSEYTDSKQRFGSAFGNGNQAEENKFFMTLNNSENLHVEHSADYSNSKKADLNLENKDQLEEINYFEALNNLESFPVKNDISNYTNYGKKANSAFGSEHQNAFSKDDLKSANIELSASEKSVSGNSSLSKNKQSVCHDDLLKFSSHFEKSNNMFNEGMYNQFSERNQYSEMENQDKLTDFKLNATELKKITPQESYEVNFKKLSSNKTQKSNISHGSTKSTNNLNMSEELNNESVKSFSKENNFQFSKLISEESNQDKQVPMAYEFVKKLREEQKIPTQIQISKVKSTNEEKFDSKGFRILKNQVPNLSYFTHDEILNILKQNIVYSDDDLLVLNKPYNLVIHESKTTKEPCLSMYLDDLAKEMDKQSINPKLFTVHRLDKETTGCLLLARNETMAMHLKALLAQRKIVKKYWIITAGVPDPPEGIIDIPISEGSIDNRIRMVLHPKLSSDILYKSHSKKGKPAVTTYKVISESGNAALVEAFPKSGIKHQIRVHFGFGLGCPILGDHKYSHLDKLVPQKLPSDMLQKLHVRQSKVRHIPMHIHAKSLGIPEYFDKRDLFVNIPIPDHFKINLKRLKFKKNMMH